MSNSTAQATLIPLDIIGRGDGAIVDVEGPRTTTSLHSRRMPLASPSTQVEILDGVELAVGLTASGNFAADVRASGWNQENSDSQ